MGRFGKLPVKLPETVKGSVSGNGLVVTGPKGSLTRSFPRVELVLETDSVRVGLKGSSKAAMAAQGSARAHIANMVHGVSEGWRKQLEVNGPGYRAEARGRDLVLLVGYSHPVTISSDKVSFVVEKNVVTVEGIDKDEVGHVSALIRDVRRPNPYTGSGIKYVDEKLRRKVGKQAGKIE